MRILVVNDYATGGGAEVVVAEMLRLLAAAGHTLELFTSADAGGPRLLTYVRNRRAVRALEARIAAFRPDVVHYHNVYHALSPAVLAAGGPGAGRPRRVLTAHDFHLVCPNAGLRQFGPACATPVEPESLRDIRTIRRGRWDHRSRLHGWLKQRQHLVSYHGVGGGADLRLSLDRVICPAVAAGDLLRRGGLPVPMTVVPNPFDPSEVPREAGAGRTWPGPSTSAGERCVIVGRVAEEKGVADLIRAWPRGDPSDGTAGESAGLGVPRLLVVGDGPDRPRCERLVRELGLEDRIGFTGALPRPEAMAVIRDADRLVLASRVPEVAPMTILEAIALGTPVLAPPLDAVAELVTPARAGCLVDVVDPRALAAALDRPALPAGVTAADRAAVLEPRSPSAFVAALETVYDEVLRDA